MVKKTIKQQWHSKQQVIESYCRKGMTAKQIAAKLDVTPGRMANIIKSLDISLMRLRNEGYTDAK